MNKYLTAGGIGGVVAFAPFIALAVTGTGTLAEVVSTMSNVVQNTVPLAASLALLAFFWGLAIYLFNFGEGKEDKQKQGRNLMVYGILAIFVMTSIFGLAQLLRKSFGVENTSTLPTPHLGGTTTQ
jgi:hypothetical protein